MFANKLLDFKTFAIKKLVMKRKPTLTILLTSIFFHFCLFLSSSCIAQGLKDTIRVMAYNTLGFSYSSGCQGSIPPLYADLKTIFQFAKPDIIGLDKTVCTNTGPTDHEGVSPYYFPDTVISECFDTNYSYCPFTDISGCSDGDGSVLFYNHTKLSYSSTTNLYNGTEDIDLFKLYYNQWFGGGADTTYLYIVLCHTISGSSSTGRDSQDTTVINKLQRMFTTLPNLIYMGDFNSHNSSEMGYAYISQTDANTNFIMDDPPFHPDLKLSYPDNWESGGSSVAYYTTTTRSTTLPNSCGTTGGAKDWYDHIFLSPWIVNGSDKLTYVRNSYTTIGNDGNRIGVSVNAGTNLSAPSNVINALFNFSDKYPVEVTLAFNPILAVKTIQSVLGSIVVNNPVINNIIVLHFASFMYGQNISMEVYDICGRDLYKSTFVINSSVINKDILLTPGVYMFHFTSGGYTTTLKVVKE
jgi:hypothetical protein